MSPSPTVPTLTDGVVTLRAIRETDAPRVHEQCVDPDSVRWTQVPSPYAPEDAIVFTRDVAPQMWVSGEEWIFAIEVDGLFGGSLALRDRGQGRAEIGYGTHPAIRGTGAAERALRLLLEWGFADQGLTVVTWKAAAGNWASRHLAWRVGFSFDGVLRGTHPHRGELVDGWIGTLQSHETREPRQRWLRAPVLETDGVRLRPLREPDVVRVVEACSDERTQHWLGTMPTPYTAENAYAWFEANSEGQAAGTKVTWAVVDPAGDDLLAAVNLFDITDRDCEIGYWAHPRARGRGVVSAAARAAVGWAFEELGVERVRGVAAVENGASRAVLERVGMTSTGGERLGTVLRTGPADVAIYDVLRTEWESARPPR
ncbi:GNAT family N-acetyltransferase [Nocardioides sp. R-C-SC26]|uniref:GNAT family N-acetyltransferase n=1 Tax=Nocardioides sp. R-C-SC26 TaxID=2870414 RepID=UPI001E629FE5|nr:GNAT family N-acetyltransferase [Nocardioides sp. R-C-SC26]